MNSIIEPVTEITLTTKDVQELETELAQYSRIYLDLFGRREQKEQYALYLQGLMADLPNKSIETMILHFNGDDPQGIRNMQHFIGQGSWKDGVILSRHRPLLIDAPLIHPAKPVAHQKENRLL